ncbi:ParA family protein [Roseobacteraceae bacterium S113]
MHDLASARPKIVSIANQKGGVGKTTTAINLGAALAETGLRVVIIDLDPQGNASTGLGVLPEDRGQTSYDLLIEGSDLGDTLHATNVNGLRIVPSTVDLSSADIELVANEKRSFLLKDALHASVLAEEGIDLVLIDCPPSLSLLTVNALVASNSVLVPLQSEFFALEGLSQLMLSVREVRQTANQALRIEGVVLTMSDRRNNLSQQVEADARETLGDLVLKICVPRNVRLSEAPSFAMPVTEYDPLSKGSQAYHALAEEFLERNPALRQQEEV